MSMCTSCASFDWIILETDTSDQSNLWSRAWTALVSKIGITSQQPECIDASTTFAKLSLGVKKEASKSPDPLDHLKQQQDANMLSHEWQLAEFLTTKQSSDMVDFTVINRICTLVEHDLYMNAFGSVPPGIVVKVMIAKTDPVKKIPHMELTCSTVSNLPGKLLFAGIVSTKPSVKACIELGAYGGHTIFVSEPDFNCDSWAPA